MAKKSAYALLLQRVRQVVRAAGISGEFEAAQHFSLRVENEPWMALNIESWPTPDALQGEKRRVLVAHYFRSGSSWLPDPELEMTDAGYPIRLRQTVFGVMETRVLWRDTTSGQVMLNAGAKRDMAELLRIWAKNIREQGFAEAAARIVSSGRAGADALEIRPSPAMIEASAQRRIRGGSPS